MKKIINKILKPFGFLVIKSMAMASGGWSLITSGSFGNASNEKVNNDTALTVSAFYACVRNVSEDIAKMPLKVYRKDSEFKYEESSHPLARLLQYQPNSEMTAMSFRETMTAQAMGWGNAYAEIERNVYGEPVGLWPLRPDKVTMYRESTTKRPFYRVTTEDGKFSDIWADDIFHLHGLGSDGVSGYNIVQYASQCIGGAIGMDKFAASYFANGMHQSGHLKHPMHLSEPAQKALKKQLEDTYYGSDNAHKTLILEEGMEFTPYTINPEASQMVETRQFTVAEFCRWLRVPPHKVADLSNATFSNIEHQNIDYVQDGLLGWCERWEQALWWKLLTEKEKRGGYYFEHIVEGLLRGDIKTRYEAYAQMWDRGVISINEIRAKENMNPVAGGDKHFIPLNYTTLDNASQLNEIDATIEDMAQRIASREIKELSNRVKYASEDIDRFKSWSDNFYDKHEKYICEVISPLFTDTAFFIDTVTLRPFLALSNNPEKILEDRKDFHSQYIANNLRGYYEHRKHKV